MSNDDNENTFGVDNKVELIGHYGSDLTHALSAWTSTSRDLDVLDKNGKTKRDRAPALLNMLASEGHHCYDPETQILTQTGWKYFYELSYKDKVAAVNIKTNQVGFEIPKDIFTDDYNELMYHVKGQQLDLLVTKGHRMVVSQKRDPKIGFGSNEFQTVEEVQGKTRKYLKAVSNTNSTKLDKDFAKLLGFFIGDGHSATNNTLSFHIRKSREINFIKSLSYQLKENKNNKFCITEPGLGKWFKDNCYTQSGEKKLPDDFLSYSTEDFHNILEGLKNSDGTKKRNTFVYYTTSTTLKNQLLALAAVNNSAFSLSTTHPKNEKWSTLYRLNFTNRIRPEVALSQKNRGNTYTESWVPYRGKVYCVTVSTGAIIVKRNDKVSVSGNTPFEKSSLHFLVTSDIASHIHILKHRIGVSVNGESARYKELKEDKLYLPPEWPEEEKKIYLAHMEQTYAHYHRSLESLTKHYEESEGLSNKEARKRAKECARFYLPYGNQLTCDVMFNFRSFAHFVGLRYSNHAQREICNIARDMLVQVQNTGDFNKTLAAFGFVDKDGVLVPPFD